MPFLSRIQKVIRHTDIEYTFRMHYVGEVKPGQFFEVSVPKYGEAPISVSGIGPDYVDLTIRKVGKVTNEIFENQEGKRHIWVIHGPSLQSLIIYSNILYRKYIPDRRSHICRSLRT